MRRRARIGFRAGVPGAALVLLGLLVSPAATPDPRPASFAAHEPARPENPGARLVAGTPCTTTARACVSLVDQRAWLIERGTISRGPVPIRSGGAGHPTPAGTFTVSWKDKDHVSAELGGIPMPDAVFFAAGGIAFHEGSLTRSSAGCVHLPRADALAFYTALRRGDQVQVRAPRDVDRAQPPKPRNRPDPGVSSGTQPGIPGVSSVGPAPTG